MNEDDRKVGSANEDQSSDFLSCPDSLEISKLKFSFIKVAHSFSDPSFEHKKGSKNFWFLPRSKSDEINTLDQAEALSFASEQEEVLAHALSRTQMMLSEKSYMLEKAVAVSEHYKKRLEDFTARLEEHQAENWSLRTELEMMKDRHVILKETIDDQQLEIISLIEAIKIKDSVITNSSAVVPEKNELSSENVNLEKIEAGIHEFMKQLHLDLSWEKRQRIESEKEKASALSQLTDIKKELESSRSKVSVLERAITEQDENYRDTILSVTSEKARWKKTCTELLNSYNELEENLLPQMAMSPVVPTFKIPISKKFSSGVNPPSTSHDQMNLSWPDLQRLSGNLGLGVNSPREGSFVSGQWTTFSKEKSEGSLALNRDLIQEYLHITAEVVRLHFPNLKEISSIWLIDLVRSSPFYLYYDVMMNIMRQLERELEATQKEEAKPVSTAPIEKIDHNMKPGWMSSFLRCTRGKPKAMIKCTRIRI